VHAECADAVWDEVVTGHDGAGKAGQQLWTDVDAVLADTGTDGVKIGADAIGAANIADDAIAAEHLKADAVTEIVTAILAGLADGVAVSDILTRLNAMAKGKIARTTDTSVYKKEDGTTTAFTNVIATGGRNL